MQSMSRFVTKASQTLKVRPLMDAACAFIVAGRPDRAYAVLQGLAAGAGGYKPLDSYKLPVWELPEAVSEYLGKPLPALFKGDPDKSLARARIEAWGVFHSYIKIDVGEKSSLLRAMLARDYSAALAEVRGQTFPFVWWPPTLEAVLSLRCEGQEAGWETLRRVARNPRPDQPSKSIYQKPAEIQTWLRLPDIPQALFAGALASEVTLEEAEAERLLAVLESRKVR